MHNHSKKVHKGKADLVFISENRDEIHVDEGEIHDEDNAVEVIDPDELLVVSVSVVIGEITVPVEMVNVNEHIIVAEKVRV